MSGFGLQQLEVLVRQVADIFGQPMITLPESHRGEMPEQGCSKRLAAPGIEFAIGFFYEAIQFSSGGVALDLLVPLPRPKLIKPLGQLCEGAGRQLCDCGFDLLNAHFRIP